MRDRPRPFVELNVVREGLPGEGNLEALTSFVPSQDEVPHAQIQDALRTINRRFDRFPLRARAMSLYTNNRVVLLGNKETVRVPSFLPGWRVDGPRGIGAYVNAVPYVPAQGPERMDVRVLFGLLLVGGVLVDSYERWPAVSRSAGLARAGAAVYSRMVFKAVDRITGVGTDRMRSDQLRYLLAKYFVLNLMGQDPGDGPDAVAAGLSRGTSPAALEAAEVGAAEAAGAPDQGALYSLGLFDFVGALAGSSPWMHRLTRRGFLQAAVALYGPAAALACEDLGYFLCALATHQAGSELVNSYSFEPVFQPEGPDAIAEFARASAG